LLLLLLLLSFLFNSFESDMANSVQTLQGKGNHFYAVHWNPWIWLTALSLIDDGAGPPLFDTGCQTDDVAFLEDGDQLVSREVRPSDTTEVVIRGDVECKDGSAQTEGFDTGRKSQVRRYTVGLSSAA
jgi:hypothetical protein